jgi:signal transduction histidine kinase
LATRIDDAIPGRTSRLTVSAIGVGMTREVRERLFEPFFTTKESAAVVPARLSMAHALVRQTAGHIGRRQRPRRAAVLQSISPPVRSCDRTDAT